MRLCAVPLFVRIRMQYDWEASRLSQAVCLQDSEAAWSDRNDSRQERTDQDSIETRRETTKSKIRCVVERQLERGEGLLLQTGLEFNQDF